jgi:hypothetical protein
MKFMVMIDGSKPAERAFDMASKFATKDDEVVLCHACQFPDTIGMAPIGVSVLPGLLKMRIFGLIEDIIEEAFCYGIICLLQRTDHSLLLY